MLNHNRLRVLVVEDDYILASSLALDLERHGASVVGPFRDVYEGIRHVDLADAAILDVRLGDESAFPIADCLLNQQRPFLFLSAYDRTQVPGRFELVPHFTKPAQPDLLLRELLARVARQAPAEVPDAMLAIPVLRLRARALISDETAADRLVEAALMTAIRSPLRARDQAELERRLLDLVEAEHRRRGRHLMN